MADENAPSQKTVLGRSKIFTPEVIDDIHMKAELGRYRMRGFSMFKKIPHWDELIFLPGTLTRFVIEGYREKCETKTVLGARFAKNPIELDIPIFVTTGVPGPRVPMACQRTELLDEVTAALREQMAALDAVAEQFHRVARYLEDLRTTGAVDVKPDGEATPVNESGGILAPVTEAVLGSGCFLFHTKRLPVGPLPSTFMQQSLTWV